MLGNKITAIGGAGRDIMFYVSDDDVAIVDNKDDLLRQKLIGFEYGAKVYSDQVYFTYGGGGANVAVNLATLGIGTQAILSLGKDFVGEELLAYLRSKKIGTNLIQRQTKARTGQSMIINVGSFNEHVILAYRGANDLLSLTPQVLAKVRTPWVYLTSLSGHMHGALDNVFAHIKKRKIKMVWNPGQAQLKLGLKKLAKYMSLTTVFDVNRDEALELLVGLKQGAVKNNINQILKKLHKYGQQLTVVTDGHYGAYVYDGQKVYFRAAFKKKGINTTGAGDSFGAAFTAGFIKYKGDITKSLKLAIYNSNSVIMKIGAQVGILEAKDLHKFGL